MRPARKLEAMPESIAVSRKDMASGEIYETITRHYKLITPLFGGGVETQKADPVTVIRGSSIRGHLRFWWRATRGGQWDGTLKSLREAEMAVWGTAAKPDSGGPSRVQIAVHVCEEDKGNRVEAYGANYRATSAAPGYASFPLNPPREDQRRGVDPKPVLGGVAFRLILRFPRSIEFGPGQLSLRAEIEAALWAWETFGGIGGRTRRGFGALQLLESSHNNTPVPIPTFSSVDGVQAWVREQLQRHVIKSKWPAQVPHLEPASRVVVTSLSWNDLIEKLRDFRQWRTNNNPGLPRRDRQPADPGRNRWPEPDVIRKLTHRYSRKTGYDQPIHPGGLDRFPRAAFGLPIIFHFRNDGAYAGEPLDVTLQGDPAAKIERLASPLVLRPFASGNSCFGLAVVLTCPQEPPGGVWLKNKSEQPGNAHLAGQPRKATIGLSQQEANRIDALRPYLDSRTTSNSAVDVLQAFLNFLSR